MLSPPLAAGGAFRSQTAVAISTLLAICIF